MKKLEIKSNQEVRPYRESKINNWDFIEANTSVKVLHSLKRWFRLLLNNFEACGVHGKIFTDSISAETHRNFVKPSTYQTSKLLEVSLVIVR